MSLGARSNTLAAKWEIWIKMVVLMENYREKHGTSWECIGR
jgi:hypothetical protein